MPHRTHTAITAGTVTRVAVLLILAVALVGRSAGYDEDTATRAEQAFARGLAAYNGRHWAEAEARFRESVALVPHPVVEYMLAATFVALERREQARAWAERALADHPSLPAGARGLGVRYHRSATEIVRWADPEDSDAAPILAIPLHATLGLAARPPGRAHPGTAPWAEAPAADLSGTWECDDGGTYYLRHVDHELWWLGQSADGGRSWANVLHGRVLGNEVVGSWADVRRAGAEGAGDLVLRIEAEGRLRTLRSTGGFAGTVWRR